LLAPWMLSRRSQFLVQVTWFPQPLVTRSPLTTDRVTKRDLFESMER
jgi:hypothetical protein